MDEAFMDEALKKKQLVRFEFLNKLYEITDGITHRSVPAEEITEALGLSKIDSESAVNWLEDEYLIKDESTICCKEITITHSGVREVEQATYRPEQETTHFAPLNVLHQNITINHSSGVQIGNNNSQKNITKTQINHQVFENIKNKIKNEVSDTNEQQLILSKLNTLENSLGTPSSLSNYQDFISSAANHMTILAPLLPALTQLI